MTWIRYIDNFIFSSLLSYRRIVLFVRKTIIHRRSPPWRTKPRYRYNEQQRFYELIRALSAVSTISRTVTEFNKHRKNSSNRGNSCRTSKLTDELLEETIGLLPPKWLLSWINIWKVLFRPKLFAVSSISHYHKTSVFPLSTFRRGRSGV